MGKVDGMHCDAHEFSEDWAYFNSLFSKEEDCERALFRARWPHGFVCPRCASNNAYTLSSRKLFQCRSCTYQVSLISGTVFARSRIGLRKWFFALYLVSKYTGINAVQLQKAIQVTYKTAWLVLSKIRQGITHSMEDELLSGIVQVDSAVFGKQYHTKAHYQPGEHPVIIGGMIKSGQPTQVLIKRITPQPRESAYPPNIKYEVHKFIENHVDSKADAIQPIYNSYRYRTLRWVVHAASSWIKNRYGSIGPKHLQTYINEFSFRYNAWNVEVENHEIARDCISRIMQNQNHLHKIPPNAICQTMLDRLVRLCSTRQAKTYKEITLNTRTYAIRFKRFEEYFYNHVS